MSKHRVYDIAKELNTDNKTILDILRKNNIEVKSHSSTVDDAARQLVVKAVKGNSQPGAKPQPQAAAKQQVAAKVQQAVQPMNRQKQVQPQAQPQQKKQEQKSGQQPKAQAQQAKQQGQQPQYSQPVLSFHAFPPRLCQCVWIYDSIAEPSLAIRCQKAFRMCSIRFSDRYTSVTSKRT